MSVEETKLESWKQIAAYLDRSERTVRRWEEVEALPVHRHDHGRGGTVVAYPEELDRWREERVQGPTTQPGDVVKGRRWLLGSSIAAMTAGIGAVAVNSLDSKEAGPGETGGVDPGYLADYQAITRVIDCYIAGGRAGSGDLMRPGFHRDATRCGFCFGIEYSGTIEHLFRWVDENGPAPNMTAQFNRIEIMGTIAIVNLEVDKWSGHMCGNDGRISEMFTLLKRSGVWQITQKAFHWRHTSNYGPGAPAKKPIAG